MVQVYGRQMEKYLECLLREGLREGKAKVTEKNRASLVRLMLWLEEWEKTGRVEGCKGREVEP
jgi:nucleoporin GLE1